MNVDMMIFISLMLVLNFGEILLLMYLMTQNSDMEDKLWNIRYKVNELSEKLLEVSGEVENADH